MSEKKSIMLRLNSNEVERLELLQRDTGINVMSKAIVHAMEQYPFEVREKQSLQSENFRLKRQLEEQQEIIRDYLTASKRLDEIFDNE